MELRCCFQASDFCCAKSTSSVLNSEANTLNYHVLWLNASTPGPAGKFSGSFVSFHQTHIFQVKQENAESSRMLINHTHARNVPRVLIWCMRSYLFISVSRVPVSEMALALFTRMSMPPNFFTASSTADVTCFSSRTSTTQGRHLPPAASTEIDISIFHTLSTFCKKTQDTR